MKLKDMGLEGLLNQPFLVNGALARCHVTHSSVTTKRHTYTAEAHGVEIEVIETHIDAVAILSWVTKPGKIEVRTVSPEKLIETLEKIIGDFTMVGQIGG